MLGELLRPEIEELIERRDFTGMRQALSELVTAELADLFADLPPEDVAIVFRILPRERAADVFACLPMDRQESLLHAMGQEQVAAVLNDMAPDDRTALLEEVPSAFAQRLLGLLTPNERRIAVNLLGYPEDSVGRRMTPDYVAIRDTWTVAEMFTHLRSVGREKETLNILYVVDDRGLLIDDILLRQIVLADPAARVADLMDGNFVALRAADDQEEAVRAFKKHDRTALPVVDSTGTLVGIVTVDDVLDVAEEEETEDVQKMGAVQALEAPYLDVRLRTMVRKRASWLLVLFLGELLTATAVGHYESEIAAAVVLAVFMPLIISSGGNSGSQAATLVIRAMAIGEINLRHWWVVMRREFMAGLMLGGILGLVALVRVIVRPPAPDLAGKCPGRPQAARPGRRTGTGKVSAATDGRSTDQLPLL